MEVNDWSDMSKFDNIGSTNIKMGGSQPEEQLTEVTDWCDLRKYDDDHDSDWFRSQEQLMAEKYGGNFIKVKYTNNGNVVYFCELCLAECNAKKSLDLHCSGMKHLKKKDMWEKEGKPPANVFALRGSSTVATVAAPQESARDKRSKSPVRKPPPRRGRERRRSPSRSRSRSRSRGRHSPPPYWNNHRRRHGSIERDMPGRFGRDFYSPVESRRDRNYGYDGFYLPPPERYPEYDYDGDIERRSRPTEPPRRTPPRPRYEGGNSPTRNAPPPPSPPRFHTQPPPSSSNLSSETKTGLSANPAGSLLQKLSECSVKSSEDAGLALSIVTALIKSLKEYSLKKNETKIYELLVEAELKVGTAKALKVGIELLSNSAEQFKLEQPNNLTSFMLNSSSSSSQVKRESGFYNDVKYPFSTGY